MKYIDKDIYKEHVRKAIEINPDYEIALIEAGRIDVSEGNRDEGQKKLRKAYDIMMPRWKTGSLKDSASIGWLAAAARELGENDIAKQVEQSSPDMEDDCYYDSDNLSMTRTNMLTNK